MIQFRSELCWPLMILGMDGLVSVLTLHLFEGFSQGKGTWIITYFNLNLLGIKEQFATKCICPVCITSFFIHPYPKVTSSTCEAVKL